MGVSRSNLIVQLKGSKINDFCDKKDDEAILAMIKEIIKERPTYGYRRVAALVRLRASLPINHKKVFRIMKRHHLLLLKSKRGPKRKHTGKIETLFSNTRLACPKSLIQS